MSQAFLHARTYLRWYILLALLFISVLLFSVILREDRNGILTFVVLDIGQGDALFIESPTGTQVLVDGCPGKVLMKEISIVMPWYDRHIDMLVVTNPDKDHYEGFIPLLDKYAVDVVLESGTHSPTPEYVTFEKEMIDNKISKILARRGQIIDLGGGAYLQVLFPDRDVSGLSSNNGSIVTRLVYGHTSVILQGDSTSNIENYLVTLVEGNLKSTILKAGHHGSRAKTSGENVTRVSPLLSVISSGINNSYGHPHKETLDTLNKLKIPTLDTCNNGRIIFESDGKSFILKNKNPILAISGCVKK